MNWKFTDSKNSVVYRVLDDGRMESVLLIAPEIQKWIADGNTPEPADAHVLTAQEEINALEASHPIPHRTLRETILAVGQIASQLTGQPMTDNPTISRIIELEAQIAALRAQL